MRTTTTGAGVAVLAVLAAGWLLGLAAQRAIIVTTTYGDISPQLMLLGLAMPAPLAAWMAAMARGVTP